MLKHAALGAVLGRTVFGGCVEVCCVGGCVGALCCVLCWGPMLGAVLGHVVGPLCFAALLHISELGGGASMVSIMAIA